RRDRDRGLALDLPLAVEVDRDLLAVAHQGDVVPLPQLQRRRAGERLILRVAIEEDELAGVARGADEAEVVAGRVPGAVLTAREQPTGDRPGIGREAVPEPELGGVGRPEVLQIRLHASAGELNTIHDPSVEAKGDAGFEIAGVRLPKIVCMK